MKLPRDLAGEALAQHLAKLWQYERVHQVGSHIILQTASPSHHRIAIPAHSPLRLGTLHSIVSAVAAHKGVSKEDVLKRL